MLTAETEVISITAPGVPITGVGEEGRKLARELNSYLGDLSSHTNGPFAGKFAFFGALPDFNDVEGTVAEIEHLYTKQKLASGVGIYSNYGGKLPGHPDFKPIWAKLQEHKALVHLHPTDSELKPGFIGGFLPQPIIDFPQNTTRAAIDLIITGTVRACPDVDIILSHVGGTLPYLGARALGSLTIPPIAARAGVTHEQAIEDMGRFYYDIAVSTSAPQLEGLLHFVQDKSRILFGSDFPYAPMQSIMYVQQLYKQFLESSPKAEVLKPEALRGNALALLNKHSLGRVYE